MAGHGARVSWPDQAAGNRAPPGELGAVTDVLIVALGTGGTASVLASSLRTFLAQPRRSDVRITVQAPDGSRVEVDAKRVADVENLVRQALSPGPPAN